jgi:hypothetical protein
MNTQPAEALDCLNNKVVGCALAGEKGDDMQYYRFIREAQSIAPGTILNDTALILVSGAFNRFDDADKFISRAQQWSSVSAKNAYELSLACVFAWRPEVALDYMRHAADKEAGNLRYLKGYYKFAMQVCATESMQDALVRADRVGVQLESPASQGMQSVAQKLQSLSICEKSVIRYIQEAANVVKSHFEKQPFSLLVTHPRLVMDHDSGESEILFDFVLHASPEKGAQIEWDLAFAEMPHVSDHVRDNIQLGVHLVDEFEDMEIKPEVIS